MHRHILAVFLLLTGCRDQLVDEAERAVKTQLLDPYSAKFEEVERCDKPNAVEGFVNSKNVFGAYTGRDKFYYIHRMVFLESMHQSYKDWFDIGRDCMSDDEINLLQNQLNGIEL